MDEKKRTFPRRINEPTSTRVFLDGWEDWHLYWLGCGILGPLIWAVLKLAGVEVFDLINAK